MDFANCLRHLFLVPFAAIVALWIPKLAYGQGGIPGYPDSIYAFDSREVAMLPRFCLYAQDYRQRVPGGNNPEEIARWSAVMGEVFGHMHHYCYGLMNFNRATLLAREPHVRRFYLQTAIKEFDYVLERSPPNFVLLPEILTKKGEALVRQGRAPLAIEQFERAIELKPDYWAPYAYLSDVYKGTGDLQTARQVLERGLSQSPDAKGLQRRLKELEAGPAGRKGTPTPARKPGAGADR
jgi:tetratricopeptide (TPR) repeat protein